MENNLFETTNKVKLEEGKSLKSKIYNAIFECNRTRMNLKLSKWEMEILTEDILKEFKVVKV